MDIPLAAYMVGANYPTGDLSHKEPLVSYDGKLIGAWMDEEKFLKDYQLSTRPDLIGKITNQSEMNVPKITLIGPDNKTYNPFDFQLVN